MTRRRRVDYALAVALLGYAIWTNYTNRGFLSGAFLLVMITAVLTLAWEDRER